MSTIPSGYLFDNTPLTGMESAILISVDNWAKENTSWYRFRNILKTCTYLSVVITLILIFIFPSLSFIGILFFLSSIFLLKSSKPEPIKFLNYAGTLHNMINWKGNYHFITKNPSYSTIFDIRQGITSRTPHDPKNIKSPDKWTSGDNVFHRLSLDSFDKFIEDEKINFENITSGAIIKQVVNIINRTDAVPISNLIQPLFDDEHFGEDIYSLATLVDGDEFSNVADIFNWIDETIEYNSNTISKYIRDMYSEKHEYDEWVNHIKSECYKLNAISFDSTGLGWDNSLKGLYTAQVSLEQSVAADVIAQEEIIKREMEQTEARLREKRSDFELQISEKHEELTRKSDEIEGMIKAQQHTVGNIQSIDVAPRIQLQTKYGITKGGGGSIGASGGSISNVYSSVETEYYDIENPAYKTLMGIEQIAKGNLMRYSEMKNAISKELSELGGAFQRRFDKMKEQQEERLNEIEIAKERAIEAIKKDSKEVISLQYLGGDSDKNPWSNLEKRNLLIWMRPYIIVSDLLTKYNKILEEFERFEIQINHEKHEINSLLSVNTTGPYKIQKLIHHWVILNENAYSEIISIGPIMFDDVSKVQIEKGISYDYFGLEYEDIKPIKLTYENLESCIYSLASRNAISSDVYNTLIKFKNITLSGVLN